MILKTDFSVILLLQAHLLKELLKFVRKNLDIYFFSNIIFLTFRFLTVLYNNTQDIINKTELMQETRRDNIIQMEQCNNTTIYEDFNENKNREFGKDITNAFICARKSLDQNINKNVNVKQTKLNDFKTFYQTKDLKKSQTINMAPSRFGAAPKQSQGINSRKPLKKQSCALPSNQMEIDSYEGMKTENCKTENIELNNSMYVSELNGNNLSYNENTMKDLLLVNSNNLSINSSNINYSIQEVPEYSQSIFLHLKETEFLHPEYYPFPNYMRSQNDINDKMRSILYDWLVDVHLKFKLLPETLFLTYNLIDRYLNNKTIPRSKLQLVGVASMLIACKYEEIYAPVVKDFVFITDQAYTADEIKIMELDILGTLEFNVTMPSAYTFVQSYHHFIKYNGLVLNFTNFLLELSIVDYNILKHKASLLAAAVLYVSTKLLHKENICFNENIESDLEKLYNLSGYTEDEIKECAKDVCLIYDNSDRSGLKAIKKKFSLPKFDQVSKIKFGK